jgi:hypothetical protein
MEKVEQPFAELPQALVEEMLSKSEMVGDTLYVSFKEIQENKEKMRNQLLDSDMLRRDSEIGYPAIPTTCGIDGSYGVERLLAIDFVACAAVAIEGLTPPSEKRHWEKPHHVVFIHPQTHNPETGTVIRGLMMEMEMELSIKAPHDVVFLDGSLTTPLIYMNQAINKMAELEENELTREIKERFDSFLGFYKTILESRRSDKVWAGVPKYTTKRELGEKFGWASHYDDRAILTSILNAGEFTKPITLGPPSQPWHLKQPTGGINREFDEILRRIYVMYYKPHKWTPVLRIEMASSIATNSSRIAVLLQGLKYQCGTPGILEPYPLFIADRMVKHLGKAIPAFRQTATKRMTELHTGDVGEIFFSMHGFRTESGR